MSLDVELVTEIASVPAEQWDALAGEDDPFIEHAFLLALEESGSVGGDSGWIPLHVVVRQAGRLVGALPCYVKLHSYGEYIFDWRWAAGAERAGIAYYPKLVSMVPFTPATGRRVLWANDADAGHVVAALAQGVEAARDQVGASSVHFLFLTEQERALLLANSACMPRESLQFHWHNEGYRSFDDYLERFRSALRKQVRRERKQALEAGLEIKRLRGPELDDRQWAALYGFYVDTCRKRGSGPYLNRAFFERIRATHATRVLAVLAYRGHEPIAGTLNFEKGRHLYGRYWGCSEDVPGLHFECCYYQLIEHAIAVGSTRFEAGAQGTHKLRRGLLPALIHSAHGIEHPGLRKALAIDLRREIDAVRLEFAALSEHGPFKRGS
jgi:predicted N-acyltransferase